MDRRAVLSCLFGTASVSALNAQQGLAPRIEEARAADGVLRAEQLAVGPDVVRTASGIHVGGKVTARRVHIAIGSTELTADEAQIIHGSPATPAEYRLLGNVTLRATLTRV
jgi:hypothetical protein